MSGVVGSIHTGMQVQDLERSIRFYVDVVGLRERERRIVTDPYIGAIVGVPSVEIHQAFLDIPGSSHWLELLEYRGVERGIIDPNTVNTGTVHLCLEVEDLENIYLEWQRKGARFLSEPVTPTSGPNRGGRVIYMTDPDGIRVELIERPLGNVNGA